MESRKSLVPFVVAALLLLVIPALYVGSYLTLVKPLQGADGDRFFWYPVAEESPSARKWLHVLFRPLEWMDGQLRPESWLPPCP